MELRQHFIDKQARVRTVFATACIILVVASLQVMGQVPALPASAPGASTLAHAHDALTDREPVFIENRGQWGDRAKYLLRTEGLDMWVTDNGVVYDVRNEDRGHVVRMTFAGTEVSHAHGVEQQPGVRNYFIGNDPTRWASDVRSYRSARVEGLYPGVDAVYYLDAGRPRYDLLLAPGADPAMVTMRFEGTDRLRVAANGSLSIGTSLGDLTQQGLYAYQMVGSKKRQVSCAFALKKDGTVGFTTGSYDRTRPLVIDPLLYSTFIGGTGADLVEALAVAVDAAGAIYITGQTSAATINFPTTTGAYDVTLNGNTDVFVAKLDPSASGSAQLAYSTYLGGASADIGNSIGLGDGGMIFVTGTTSSTAFPTTSGAYSTTIAGGSDAFVAVIDPAATGSAQLVYSTFLGGSGADASNGLVLEEDGIFTIAGTTADATTDWPTTTGAYDATHNGSDDVFIARIDRTANGSAQLVYSTLLGGSGFDRCNALTIDTDGILYLTGESAGGTGRYPTTTGAFDEINSSNSDVFVSKLDPSASGSAQLVYSTFLGGATIEVGTAIAVDADGMIYLTGIVVAINGIAEYPTTSGAFDTTPNGHNDAFATKLDPSASGSAQLVYSTFLGSALVDQAYAIAVDAGGFMYVTGSTSNSGGTFPTTTDAFDATFNGADDVFLTKIDPSATGTASVVYSTFFGGNSSEQPSGIFVDGSGVIYLTGLANSQAFPTTSGAYDVTHNRFTDVFVLKFLIGGTISFSTANEGVTWCAGSTQNVTWASSGISTVRIELSSNAGSTWSTIVAGTPASTGSYSWAIPGNQAAGTSYRIRVSDSANVVTSDASDASFTINAPPSVTSAPVSNSPTCPGTPVQFNASATGTPAPTTQWQISTDDGATYADIAGATTGSLLVDAPTLAMNGYRYRAVYSNNCSIVKSAAATLSVEDNIAPVPGVPTLPEVTGECSASIASAPTATDDCGGTITGTTADPMTYTAQGTFTVLWSYDDGNGNTSTQTQTVIVDDVTAPTITAPADLTVDADAGACAATVVALGTATTGDNCSIATSSNDHSSSTYPIGTTIVTWTATDAVGNTQTATQSVTVVDNQAPVLTLASEAEIWSRNHDYRTFDIGSMITGISDNCTSDLGTSDARIWKVTSDELEESASSGDGNTLDDIVIAGDCQSVQLRRERDGTLDGRVYRVYIRITDDNGNTSSDQAYFKVSVGHSANEPAVDNGVVNYQETCGGTLKPAIEATELGYLLMQNAPNPFGTRTWIEYTVARSSGVTLAVYDATGNRIATIVDAHMPAGTHSAEFDGSRFASGTYAYVLKADGVVLARTMVLVR
jgi:hypothetical protein